MDAASKVVEQGAKRLDRKTIGPKALLRSLVELARKAGALANDNAHAAYAAQFSGRVSYDVACEADRMENADEAFAAWSEDAEIGRRSWGQAVWVCDLVKAQTTVRAAFLYGWQSAEDGR